MSEETPTEDITPRTRYQMLPLRDVVVFPHMVLPLFVGREKSINALEEAVQSGKQIFLAAQHDAADDDPAPENIFGIGTVANILQLLKLPDGTVKVLVEGVSRAGIVNYVETEESFVVDAAPIGEGEFDEREGEVLMRTVTSEFEQYVKLNSKIPPEVLASLSGIEDPGRLADTIAAHLTLRNDEKQKILELGNARERLEHILGIMESEIDLLQVEKRLRGRVKKQMEKSQREYYLNEQMKAIQKELGDMDDAPNEMEELQQKVEEAGMPKEAREKAESELKKLRMMSPMSAEATVVRNYVEWLAQVPWKKRSRVLKDLAKAESVLEADHFGLDKVKERILEYLAVQQRINKVKGPILCLVGPPGVGKTSWASPSLAPPIASLYECPWAVSVMKRKSVVIAGPISGLCRVRLFRTWPAPAPATRCSCWMKLTRCRWTFAGILRRLYWRFLIRSRITSLVIITSRLTMICPK
jgi:ATP-dependent Lon protease